VFGFIKRNLCARRVQQNIKTKNVCKNTHTVEESRSSLAVFPRAAAAADLMKSCFCICAPADAAARSVQRALKLFVLAIGKWIEVCINQSATRIIAPRDPPRK
jgi:hypothetical protein